MKKETIIISTNKIEASYYADSSNHLCLILDTNDYKDVSVGGMGYPANYINSLIDYIGLVDIIFVDDYPATRDLLDKNNISFTPVMCIIGGGGIPSPPGTYGHAFIAPNDEWCNPDGKESTIIVMIAGGYGPGYSPQSGDTYIGAAGDGRRTIRTYKGITDELIKNIRENGVNNDNFRCEERPIHC